MTKKLDAQVDCSICGAKVVCRLDKKQNLAWYNLGSDQKHFQYDPNTQKTTCRKPDEEKKEFTSPAATPQSPGTKPDIVPLERSKSEEELDKFMDGILSKEAMDLKKHICRLWAIERFVTKELVQREGKQPEKQRVGMYVKILMHPVKVEVTG